MTKYKIAILSGGLALAITAANPVMAEDDFSGPYVGAGAGWTEYDIPIVDANGNRIARFREGAVNAQISAGYDFPLGDTVRFGVELAAQRAISSVDEDVLPGVNLRVKPKWAGTASARLGVLATPSTLLYARGGLITERTRTTFSGPASTTNPASVTNTDTKLIYGGGIEQAVSENMRLRVEYLRSNGQRRQSVMGGLVFNF